MSKTDTKYNIVVLGGGSAGWLSACILAAKFQCATRDDFSIALIESPDIPTIGVGEGTVPTMRQTLKLIGVSETDFIRECDATLKQSIKFVDWMKAETSNGSPHFYHHAFNLPVNPGFDLTPYWLEQKGIPYANYIGNQQVICERNLAPKRITDPEYTGCFEYAYHLDALKFSRFLKKHGTERLGINYLQAKVEDVSLSSEGSIERVITDTAGNISADFFVDCSGFASRLLGQALEVPFVDKGDELFVDNALAIQVPYEEPNQSIPCFTIATAREAGWIWDIGLTKRRGVGYVYSSRYTNDDRAESVLREYLQGAGADIEPRKIPMRVGYRKQFWHKNCAAIGLSAGFVEPLEATALLLVEAMAKLLAEKMPSHPGGMEYAAKSFNRISENAWLRVIDFIKLHYYLSNRDDNQFWVDNRADEFLSDELLDKLNYWKHHLPSASDFESKYEVFQLENYQYVLYGMNYLTDLAAQRGEFIHHERAAIVGKKLEQQLNTVQSQLKQHRDFIAQVKQFGMKSI